MNQFKHGTKEYWMDWYWNRGGRDKVQARRLAAKEITFKHQKLD